MTGTNLDLNVAFKFYTYFVKDRRNQKSDAGEILLKFSIDIFLWPFS